MTWNEVVRPFLSVVVAYFLILACLITLLLPKIRSQVLVLYLVLKNIFTKRGKHNSQFIKAYKGNLTGALVLMLVLMAIAFGITTLLKPMLILTHEFTLREILITESITAAMFAFIIIRGFKTYFAPLGILAGVAILLVFLAVFLWGEGVAMILALILAFNPWVKIDGR